ncbi:paramyosin-like isoform X4 [Panicum virgatum]|uniref:paramyosin-like isoform X4 n=1 Tax=Panicum virgatum TaxID=38727 RepID=UPI0019D533E6|nr:paramyosin-like isoform X4 [Panicum virgatum]
MDEAADSSALLRRVEELQLEKDEKQNALEVLIRRVEGLQYEMDEKVDLVEVLTHRVEELQRERDELRKDIEQLCMQQAGPGYVSVATRMLSQRTATLEQDVENLQKKLNGCLRENQNLQEELAEAYRVKNKDLEKQVRFFQCSVAQAFSERDSSLMECEKAKEQEEAVLKKFADFEERTREYQSAIDDQKHLNDDLQRKLTELKAETESSMKVILKFYDLRCRDCECPSNITFEEKCSILLDDSADNWSFSSDGGTSTLKYIASLEEEKESLKAKMAKLQSNLRMGLEIEQHLQRNARILEKRQALYDGFLRSGLSELQKFYKYQRAEIMKTLEEESSRLIKLVAEIQDKLSEICINTEVSEHPGDVMQCCDSSCKDVHVTTDISPSTFTSPKLHMMQNDSPADSNSISFDESKALAQALQEKMEALMLFSQEQERYLLEKQKDQIVIEDLQKKLSQVKDEKVKVLMELAKLKEEYLQLKGLMSGRGEAHMLASEANISSAVKEGHGPGDSSKAITGHDQQGMLKTMLKRTSLRHWMRSSNVGHGSSDGNDHIVCKEHSVDIARLRVENATLLEGVGTVERLTSSVHRLHIVLLKANDDVKSAGSLESTFEALNSLITEANLMKTALSTVLPVSWSGDSSDAITYEALCDPSDSPKSKSEKVDPLSFAGMEMVELLIFAAEVLKESFLMKK